MNNRNKKFITCIKAIPSGKVATYGQIASLAGYPRGHRQVAKFLRTENCTDIPWYRVLRADGKLGFPTDSNDWLRQSKYLKQEGVLMNSNRVDLKRHQWQAELDFLLFHPDL